jgi:hypothetical protein
MMDIPAWNDVVWSPEVNLVPPSQTPPPVPLLVLLSEQLNHLCL